MEINPYITSFTPLSPRTWPPLLTVDQVSKILNLSPWTLRQWDNLGRFKALRVGSRKDRRYKKEDVLKVLDHGLQVE